MKIKQVVIPVSPHKVKGTDSLTDKFVDAIGELKKECETGRVYKTYVYDSERDETSVLMTTSKDVYLEFGPMSNKAQVLFVRLLEREFKSNAGQLILVFDKGSGESNRALLIVRSVSEDGDAIYTISLTR